MTDDFDAESHVRNMAQLMGLTIDEAWFANVLANVEATRAAARLVGEFPLATHEEPAPVFEP